MLIDPASGEHAGRLGAGFLSVQYWPDGHVAYFDLQNDVHCLINEILG